jgi:hypothetical protein
VPAGSEGTECGQCSSQRLSHHKRNRTASPTQGGRSVVATPVSCRRLSLKRRFGGITIPSAMSENTSRAFVTLVIFVSVVTGIFAASVPSVTVEKPKARTTTGGHCRILSGGTLSGSWGPDALPTLSFVVGPQSVMADQFGANKTKYTGPGKYPNVIVAVYLGKTAREDVYGGLGTVVMNPDGHTGTFLLNDGSASGHFDCGLPPKKPD